MVTAAVLMAILTIASVLLRSRMSIEPPPAVVEAEPLASDRTPRLVSQFTADARGSRAPPAASA